MKYCLLVCGLFLVVQDDSLGDSFSKSFHSHRRKSGLRKSDIWSWDYWCQMQPKRGNCTGNTTRHYYDAQLDQCMTFQYSGCHGNKNSFETALKCMARCRGSTYNTLKPADRKVYCSLQPSSGMCLGMFSKFYYDINEKICKTYMYGGCGGNQNRFESFSECAIGCHGFLEIKILRREFLLVAIVSNGSVVAAKL